METSVCEINMTDNTASALQASDAAVSIASPTNMEILSRDLTTGALPNKSTPKRAMVLTGIPTPALPPRPTFPPELEQYQVQGAEKSKLSTHVHAYLSILRQDYEKQLKEYDLLKKAAQEDTYFSEVVVDEIDALDEDPLTLDSFETLMRLHASKDKDFIVARVTTQDPIDENKVYHSYYGAHQINKVLFRTQPKEGLLHRMKARNVSHLHLIE